MFELILKDHIIVTQYTEDDIVIHGVRDNITLKEQNVEKFAEEMKMKQPKQFNFTSTEEMTKYLTDRSCEEIEGFILIDEHYNRIKVKHPDFEETSNRYPICSTISIHCGVEYLRDKIWEDKFSKRCPEFKQIVQFFQHKYKMVRQKVISLILKKDTTIDEIKESNVSQFVFALRKKGYASENEIEDAFDNMYKSVKTLPIQRAFEDIDIFEEPAAELTSRIGNIQMNQVLIPSKECIICMAQYGEDIREPRILSCGHTVCLNCLKIILQTNNNQQLEQKCPICRRPLLSAQEKDYPKNYALLEETIPIEDQCQIHSQPLNRFCKQCKIRCCQQCCLAGGQHSLHQIQSLQEFLQKASHIKAEIRNMIAQATKQEQQMNSFIDSLEKRWKDTVKNFYQRIFIQIEKENQEIYEKINSYVQKIRLSHLWKENIPNVDIESREISSLCTMMDTFNSSEFKAQIKGYLKTDYKKEIIGHASYIEVNYLVENVIPGRINALQDQIQKTAHAAFLDELNNQNQTDLKPIIQTINDLSQEPQIQQANNIIGSSFIKEQIKKDSKRKFCNIFASCIKKKSTLDSYAVHSYSDFHLLKTLKVNSASVRSESFSPDGKNLISTGNNKIDVWDLVAAKNCVKSLTDQKSNIHWATYSPDGNQILSASNDSKVKLWDTITGTCQKVLNGHTDFIYMASYYKDGRYIVSASEDQTVRLWFTATGDCLSVLKGHKNSVCYASFSPDGRNIVSCSADKTIKIWETINYTCTNTLNGHSDTIWCCKYSPDGQYIASSSTDQKIIIWDSSKGSQLRTLIGHTSSINSFDFSHDGKFIISASQDSTIKIWTCSKSECIKSLQGHRNWVESVALSPDGKMIVSGSSDKTIKIWG